MAITRFFSTAPLRSLALLIASAAPALAQPPLGTWSAPSLSQPDTPIVIDLLPGGLVTERIGDYQGTGSWRPDGVALRIDWANGWVGMLRPLPDGNHRLTTWKAGSPLDGPADDDQPARQLGPPGD